MKRLFQILSLLIVAVMVLAACATPTSGATTPSPQPFVPTSYSWDQLSQHWEPTLVALPQPYAWASGWCFTSSSWCLR